jgi:hypothetical protein
VPNVHPEVRAAIDIAEVARGGHPVDAALGPVHVDPCAAAADLFDTVTALTVVTEAQNERIRDLEGQPAGRLRVTRLPTPIGSVET